MDDHPYIGRHFIRPVAVVLLLRPAGAAPIAVVAWRGSKKLSDYLRTDLSVSFVPVLQPAPTLVPAFVYLPPDLSSVPQRVPCRPCLP